MIECVNGCGQMKQTFYEGVEIDICKSCAGVWLDTGELTTIVETKEKFWPEKIINKVLSETGKPGIHVEEQNRNLSCPKCSNELPANNYQSSSGVIVNACQNGHGLWLDSGELVKIQVYMEKWDRIAKENASEYQSILEELQEEHAARAELQATIGPSGSEAINRFINKIAQLF